MRHETVRHQRANGCAMTRRWHVFAPSTQTDSKARETQHRMGEVSEQGPFVPISGTEPTPTTMPIRESQVITSEKQYA